MLRTYRNFNKPEDFADYLRETDHDAGQTGMLIATEYEAKMEHHLKTLQELFDEFRCTKGDPC